jgi:DNA-directed RNA polymerase specialized sigma24 family protein
MVRHIRLQKTKIVQSRKDASRGEQSPYWDYVKAKGSANASNNTNGVDMHERAEANPDVLPKTEIDGPSTPQLIMGEAISHLQGRQKEVYLLLMRESRTYEEVSEMLKITRGAAQTYERRAIKFIQDYCKAAIAKGRV